MDLYILISVLSVMCSWTLCTVRAVPARETPTASTVTQGRHVRTKRCSCATFLDKECVYFCHLDIIWVNTPERVVSYGLGNAPRAKRAAATDAMATSGGPRCQCFRENDSTCRNFCRLEKPLRYETLPERVTRSAEGDTGGTKRVTNDEKKQVSPQDIRSAFRTHLLLGKWRARQRRARAWPPKDER